MRAVTIPTPLAYARHIILRGGYEQIEIQPDVGQEKRAQLYCAPTKNSLNWSKKLAGGGAHRSADGREPVVAVVLRATGDGEEFFLQLARDWSGHAFAHLNVVHRADGGDFHSRAHEENFVGDIEHLAGNDSFFAGDAEILREFANRIAGDARKNAGGQWRRVERAIVRQENVHAGAFADVAAGIERDAFGEAVEGRFHANELRVHVVCGGFGHGRQRVRGNARPGADADVHTFRERVRTEVGTPAPASHVEIDRRIERVHTNVAIAAKNYRLHVAGIHFVDAHQFAGDIREIVYGVGKLHAVNAGGVDEALHVFAEAENGRALL